MIRRLEVTGSTNDEARAWARAGAPHGAAVIARHQTAGRGRLGRTWSSPPGANVLLSVVVREGLDGARLGLTSLAAAVATSRVCGERYGIKWPNDVVDALGRKVAGILAEAEWEGGRPAFLVLGIGVNVGARPADLPATCLADGGDPRSAEEVALALVPEVLRWAGAAPDEVLAAWRARAATLGSRVRVGEVEGVAVDIAEDGALVVVDEQGVRRLVLAGDVAMVG